jgi:16S rRNA G966 N2-methylase RsmD
MKEYNDINQLTDYFQEESRMLCKRYDMKYAPIEYWNNPELLYYILNKMNTRITLKSIREYIYNNIHECGTFKLTIAKSIMQLFNAKRILDFSSGWGDRLIAAISLNKQIEYYHGYDPNKNLFKGYEEIIKMYKVSQDKYVMHNMPFENSVLKYTKLEFATTPQTYDLIFTSPPYYDLEDYTHEQSQSIHTYTTVTEWLIEFLCTAIKHAWERLEDNGYMVISIEDIISFKNNIKIQYVEPMILFSNIFLEKSNYLGIIGHTTVEPQLDVVNKTQTYNFKPCRPLYVWQKIRTNNKQIMYSEKEFEQYDNRLYKQILHKFK